jgi:acetylornithine deacetylase/succinyl-diaminopimelate desuccinylase-like protein
MVCRVQTPENQVADLCRTLIRFDTTNRGNGDAEGERAAAEFVAETLGAAGVETTVLEREPGRSNVIARIPGTEPDLPAVLVQGHLDVVPAVARDWSVPPFAGEISDGYLYGRGAVDMKDTVSAVLQVVRDWAAEGRRPRRDVVLAFLADEEDQGYYGAKWLVDEHPGLFDGCAAAIGESGGFTHHANGLRLYPVATAERGTAHMRLTATGRAGHGSRRNPDNAVTRLVRALARLADEPWPVVLTPAVRAFFERAASALCLPGDLSDPSAVDELVERLGPARSLVENTIRNSTTPTVLSAGYKVNVIPGSADAEVDVRSLPGTETELLSRVDELLGEGVRRELIDYEEAVAAPIDSPWFDAMAEALRAEDPDAVVLPYCMGGGTDAKSFSRLGIHCYGFAPLYVPDGYDYRAMAHGVDERVPLSGLDFAVRVLDRFLSR